MEMTALHALPDARDYLGPARVDAVAGAFVEVVLPHETVTRRARMALAFPYRPAPGDELLVIGKDEGWYVIGVLEGRGDTVLSFESAVELHAAGPLRLSSAETVQVEAPDISLRARKLRTWAETAVSRCTTLVQEVQSLWSTRARRAETLVQEDSVTRAKTATVLTEETMTINGKQIHLG